MSVCTSLCADVLPFKLTSLVVSDTKVRRGQVDVHVMLEDFLEETLPLPQFKLLRRVHIEIPLTALGLRWKQDGKTDETSVDAW